MPQKHFTIPIFVPELACPFQCVYCNQKKISGQQEIPSAEKVIKTIEDHLSTIDYENNVVELGFFGGNFTGIPTHEQEMYLLLVQKYITEGKIQGIRLSTRPDYIDQQSLDLLKKYKVKTIELGAQSLDDEVLKQVGRGHTSFDVEQASCLIKENGFRLGLQMMIGLPGDNAQKSLKTAQKIIDLKADDIRIYPCLVIKETKLHELLQQQKYKALTLEEALAETKEIVKLFEKANMNIIRIGLHPSEALTTDKELIDGPYHPSFKELVMTEIWHDIFQDLLKQKHHRNIKIQVATKELNLAIGHKSKNKIALQEHYEVVQFIPNPELKGRDFSVEYF
jgi:histone acetyltransferase (RNA polymerase elongator complex component)